MTLRGVLDTSVFIAREGGRRLDSDRLPHESAISVVTLAELQAGVLAARDTETRGVRLATLDALATVEVLPVDIRTGLIWAQMRVHLADTGRRAGVNDLWIAATAAANGVPVVTQDDDHDAVDGVAGLSVIKV